MQNRTTHTIYWLASLALALAAWSACAFDSYSDANSAATTSFQQRDWRTAKTDFEAALKLASTPDERAAAQLHIGHCLRMTHCYPEARAAYDKVAKE